MKLNFIKASPCGNTTIFIFDKLAKDKYAPIAKTVMDYDHLTAEQLGYLCQPKSSNAIIRLEMSNNEFCGNALISLAALVKHKNMTNDDTFFLESSGTNIILKCTVQKVKSATYLAKAQMPNSYTVQKLNLKVNNEIITGVLVSFEGICHLVIKGELPCSLYEIILHELEKNICADAYGIIPFSIKNIDTYFIKPYVYVPKTQSKIFERACGSGSLALGIVLSKEKEKHIKVINPGGVLEIDIGKENYLTGIVSFTCEGTVFID